MWQRFGVAIVATCLIRFSSAATGAIDWVAVPPLKAATTSPTRPLAPAAREYNATAGLPVRPLFDFQTRDPHILHAPDGYFYMVATAARETLPASIPARPDSDFWTFNDGIPLWRSRDLARWETAGYVWQFERDATWQKALKPSPHTGDGKPVRAIWAPEIHYMKGTYWIPYSMNYDGTGILKSTSGKPEGPYVDVKPTGPLAEAIDATIFEDDDGTVYYLDFGYRIARMKPDLSDLAEPIRDLDFRPAPPWGEGVNVRKVNGKYVWTGAGRESGSYDVYGATADAIYGPYTNRYRAIPYAGHNNLFQDAGGAWWSTLFHPSPYLNLGFRPSVVPVTMSAEGLIAPTRSVPRPIWRYATTAPAGAWTAAGFNDRTWKSGPGGFGDPKVMEIGPITDVATPWTKGGLWLRRTFTVDRAPYGPSLFLRANGPVGVTINGKEVHRATSAMPDYALIPLAIDLPAGEHVLAIHAEPGDLPYVDAGVIDTGERVLLPNAKRHPRPWAYTTDTPADGWQKPGFDTSGWATGNAGFGSRGTAGAVIHTEWTTRDIWLRQAFDVERVTADGPVYLDVQHDDDAQIYVNGILAADLKGFVPDYKTVELTGDARRSLKQGRNVIAVHCRQDWGGQAIDVGLVERSPSR